MEEKQEIRVTLSEELLNQLRKEAQLIQVPLTWLVAGLVCDTVENLHDSRKNASALCPVR